MGASVWQRDGSGGKTFTTGIKPAEVQDRAPPASRKRVWTREAAVQAPASAEAGQANGKGAAAHMNGAAASGRSSHQNGAAHHHARPDRAKRRRLAVQGRGDQQEEWDGEVTFEVPATAETDGAPSSSGAGQPPASPGDDAVEAAEQLRQREGAEARERAAAAGRLRAAQAELAALKARIQGREQRIAKEQADAAARAEGERRQREHMAKRRTRLEAGFAEAFRAAREATAAAIASGKGQTGVPGADEREVARVLGAGDDYQVLRLQPGAAPAALKRRYREMAVALHPDKCRVTGATDAFQRLVHAYQNLLKLVA